MSDRVVTDDANFKKVPVWLRIGVLAIPATWMLVLTVLNWKTTQGYAIFGLILFPYGFQGLLANDYRFEGLIIYGWITYAILYLVIPFQVRWPQFLGATLLLGIVIGMNIVGWQRLHG